MTSWSILAQQPLPSASGWFTQPWATVIAGSLAVFAALIAFAGVLVAQRRQSENLEKQLKVQQELHNDAQRKQAELHAKSLESQLELLRMQTSAADRKQDRADRLDAIIDAQRVLTDAYEASIDALFKRAVVRSSEEKTKSDVDELDKKFQRFAKSFAALRVPHVKLEVLGLTRSYDAFQSVMVEIDAAMDDSGTEIRLQSLQAAYFSASKSFSADVGVTP